MKQKVFTDAQKPVWSDSKRNFTFTIRRLFVIMFEQRRTLYDSSARVTVLLIPMHYHNDEKMSS